MTLLELLNQELSGELKRRTSLTWVLFYLIDRATPFSWVTLRHTKYLVEGITGECRTNVSNRTV